MQKKNYPGAGEVTRYKGKDDLPAHLQPVTAKINKKIVAKNNNEKAAKKTD